MKTILLQRILELTKKPGNVRALVIGFVFPEIGDILGHLAELARIMEKEEEK